MLKKLLHIFNLQSSKTRKNKSKASSTTSISPSQDATGISALNEGGSGPGDQQLQPSEELISFPSELGRRQCVTLGDASKQNFTREEEDEIADTMQRFADIKSLRVALKDVKLKCKDCKPLVLGQGSFGRVYHGSVFKEDCAVKVVLDGTRKEQSRFLKDLCPLEIQKDTIVAFRGFSVCPEGLLLLMEYLPGGSLTKSLATSDAFQWYNRGKEALLRIVAALKVLHANRIAHLAVKSPNVLMTKSGCVKLADVGLERLMKDDCLIGSSSISIAWAAPEQLCEGRFGLFSDVWAMGTLIWEVCTRELPPNHRQLREIRVPEEAPQEVVDLIHACHNPDWSTRINAEECFSRLSVCPHELPR